MSASARWTIVALVAVVALGVALFTTIDRGAPGDQGQAAPAPATAPRASGASAGDFAGPPAGGDAPDSADPAQRASAHLPACVDPGTTASTAGPIARLSVTCLADGTRATVGAVQGGRPTLLNLFAYWCAPCREELPALQEAQARLGDRSRIVLAHSDASETRGIEALARLGVDLPAVSDPSQALAGSVGAPPVLPISVFLRPDGSIAKVLAQPLDSADAVLAAVRDNLGVAA